MWRKYKITYFSFGEFKQLILRTDLVNIGNNLINEGIQLDDVMKIERDTGIEEHNIIDKS